MGGSEFGKRVELASFVDGLEVERRVAESAPPVLTQTGFRVEDSLFEPTYNLTPDVLWPVVLLFPLDHRIVIPPVLVLFLHNVPHIALPNVHFLSLECFVLMASEVSVSEAVKVADVLHQLEIKLYFL